MPAHCDASAEAAGDKCGKADFQVSISCIIIYHSHYSHCRDTGFGISIPARATHDMTNMLIIFAIGHYRHTLAAVLILPMMHGNHASRLSGYAFVGNTTISMSRGRHLAPMPITVGTSILQTSLAR